MGGRSVLLKVPIPKDGERDFFKHETLALAASSADG
jgi:hypothetical protein